MRLIVAHFRESAAALLSGWNRFWFTPADPATLGLMRVLTGAMLFYTHLVWTIDLEGFFGAHGRLSPEFNRLEQGSSFAWSYVLAVQSPEMLSVLHVAALVVFAFLCLGLFTRVSSVLAFLITVAYANRAAGALFGLDQVNTLLAAYLMVGPAGDAYSLDNRHRRRANPRAQLGAPSVMANIAQRLMQVHMCLIYAFAGWGKLLGPTWWEGTALWAAFANSEYQTLDMTWTAWYPFLVHFLTHATTCWEVAYPALVWPKPTRGFVLLLAIPLHLGIAVCMGLMTFGLIMIVGNMAFLSPAGVRAVFDSWGGAGQGGNYALAK